MEIIKSLIENSEILDIVGKVNSFEKRADALCNNVYILSCEKGKFVIKIAEGNNRINELKKEIDLLYLLKDYMNVPKVLLCSDFQDFYFFLMNFIDGNKPKKFDEFILRQMALALKKIHNFSYKNEFVDFDKLIKIAEKNMLENRLDITEFLEYKNLGNPDEILQYLKSNTPIAKSCLLHGDFRPKNMLFVDKDLFVLDWGLAFYGDIYYDFAIIKYYFTEEEFDLFLNLYGIEEGFDEDRLKYNELLSLFLNV
jgi:aminoglycoside phosphotransferase